MHSTLDHADYFHIILSLIGIYNLLAQAYRGQNLWHSQLHGNFSKMAMLLRCISQKYRELQTPNAGYYVLAEG